MTRDLDDVPVFNETTEASLLAEALVAAMINSRIYAISHPRVTDTMRDVRGQIQRLCDHSGDQTLRLGSFDRMLVFARRPLLGASLSISRLLDRLDALSSGGLEFDRAIDDAALLTFFTTLVARDGDIQTYQQLNERLIERDCRTVRLLAPYTDGVEGEFGEPLRMGLSMHQKVMDLLQNVTVSLCRGGKIEFEPVQEQVEMMLQRLETHDDLQIGLSRQDQYDAFTFGHSLRVAILAMHFARSLTKDRVLVLRVGTAALLHDVGKSLIPFEILHSNDKLSDEERREMSRHAELGGECLLDHTESDPLAIASAFGHHRTAQGGGYPKTTHDHPVTMVTSIVKICDIFEALTAARPYKLPMSPIRAYRVMISMGDSLDQRLLRKFIECNGVYPVGQHVELFDGRVAVVREQTNDMLSPKVEPVSLESFEEMFDEGPQPLIDLSQIECGCARAVLQELTPSEAAEKATFPDKLEHGPPSPNGRRKIDKNFDPFANPL
ncbi:MAG: HD-GYP domain-containing protein [Planctomycetota bacterium]